MTSSTRPGKRRAPAREVIISTLCLAAAIWVSTWSMWGVIALAGVIAAVMAINYKKFR